VRLAPREASSWRAPPRRHSPRGQPLRHCHFRSQQLQNARYDRETPQRECAELAKTRESALATHGSRSRGSRMPRPRGAAAARSAWPRTRRGSRSGSARAAAGRPPFVIGGARTAGEAPNPTCRRLRRHLSEG
jgi:hypothetical protein